MLDDTERYIRSVFLNRKTQVFNFNNDIIIHPLFVKRFFF